MFQLFNNQFSVNHFVKVIKFLIYFEFVLMFNHRNIVPLNIHEVSKSVKKLVSCIQWITLLHFKVFSDFWAKSQKYNLIQKTNKTCRHTQSKSFFFCFKFAALKNNGALNSKELFFYFDYLYFSTNDFCLMNIASSFLATILILK